MSISSVAGATVKTTRWAPWQTLGIVALGAIALGLLVPQLLPGEMVIDKNHHKAEARADVKANYEAPTLADMPNPQGMLVRLLAGTVLVLGLAVASILGMRRWLQRQTPAGQGQREMNLVETLPLGNRCSLHLVYLGKRQILIGVDGAGVKTIVPLAKAFEEVLADTEPLAPAA
jgi:flagellar biogenesis protein FliO